MFSEKNHNAKFRLHKIEHQIVSLLYVRTTHHAKPQRRCNASRYHKNTDNEIYVHLC